MTRPGSVSIVIPARDREATIGALVEQLSAMSWNGSAPEIIVVDDGSNDSTGERATGAGARVLRVDGSGNPAIARNRGADIAQGDALVFLDAGCTPRAGWLDALLTPLGEYDAVGGALAAAPAASLSARADYLNAWYHAHDRRRRGVVRQHPPCNIAVGRSTFLACGGFHERHPVAYAHEELAWQARFAAHGGRILFEPAAAVEHANRPGIGSLLRRSYRWGYSAIEAKSAAGISRWPALYRRPWIAAALSPLAAPLSTAYIVACWIKARRLEVLPLSPLIAAARTAHAAGMTIGGLRWALRGDSVDTPRRPRWE